MINSYYIKKFWPSRHVGQTSSSSDDVEIHSILPATSAVDGSTSGLRIAFSWSPFTVRPTECASPANKFQARLNIASPVWFRIFQQMTRSFLMACGSSTQLQIGTSRIRITWQRSRTKPICVRYCIIKSHCKIWRGSTPNGTHLSGA